MTEKLEAQLQSITALNDYKNLIRHDSHPEQGQFVVTGPNCGGDIDRVGYCLQVRKGVGQFGSDMILLRHAGGNITVHENQCFFAMNAVQEELARAVFTVLPEQEDYAGGYKDCEKVHEVGFIIEHSASRGSPDTSFSIMIMKQKEVSDVE